MNLENLLDFSNPESFATLLRIVVVVLVAAAYGLFVGAIPGLTATMAVALVIPFTFFLDPISALAAIVTLEATAIFAGDIPSTLVRIPGTPSSAAYTDDAYALTERGEAGRSLGVSLLFSVFGGIFGGLVLMMAAPALAKIAVLFTTYEYFWLAILGLSSAAIVARGSLMKGLFSLLLGLLISTVGLDEVHGLARITFGVSDLAGGINFIPAMIGLFGLSEVLRNVLRPEAVHGRRQSTSESILGAGFRLMKKRFAHMLRSSGVGTLIGILPGAGADIAAWVSFAVSKKISKRPEKYGKGSLEGIGDATAANNSALAGAWVPALVFGIPGDSVTAIVIGVLIMKGLQPGPAIFEKTPEILYAVYATFILANLFLIPLGYLAIRLGKHIVRVPRRFLLPTIVVFCVVGSYAINNSIFDVGLMLGMGLLGFGLERYGFPVGPVVLGIVLGPMVEKNLMFSLIKSGGHYGEFFTRPVAGVLGVVTILLWVTPLVIRLRRRGLSRTSS